MSMARFIEKWTSEDYPPERVAESDLQLVEERFAVRLPDDYRQAVLALGLPRPTGALLDAIVERELDLHDAANFFSPSEMVEETLGWREIGMPGQLIVFAGDCSGNKFCFDADRLRGGTAEAGTVWLFDHDFDTVEVVAPSFSAWMKAFCDIEQ